MKINLDAKILQLDGTEYQGLTLGVICFEAVTRTLPNDETLTGAEKLKLYRLAQVVSGRGEVEVDAEDVVTLKARIERAVVNVVVYGRALDLLEGRAANAAAHATSQAEFDAAVDGRDAPSGAPAPAVM